MCLIGAVGRWIPGSLTDERCVCRPQEWTVRALLSGICICRETGAMYWSLSMGFRAAVARRLIMASPSHHFRSAVVITEERGLLPWRRKIKALYSQWQAWRSESKKCHWHLSGRDWRWKWFYRCQNENGANHSPWHVAHHCSMLIWTIIFILVVTWSTLHRLMLLPPKIHNEV